MAAAQPKKLAFLLNHAPFLVTHRMDIARGAHAMGFEIHVIAPFDSEAAEIFNHAGFSYHPTALIRGSMNPLVEIKNLFLAVKILRKIRPDILHSVALKCIIYGGLASYLTLIPRRIQAVSGLGFAFISTAPLMRFMRTLLIPVFKMALAPAGTITIFQNPDDRALFIKNRMVKAENTVLIRGSGVNTANFTPPENPAPLPLRITMVGRFLIDKGVREFIEAARIVKQKNPDALFQLVGYCDPQNPASLSQQAMEKYVAEGLVINLGERRDIADIYRASHIACLPSYREGVPKALLEAAACGLPIVTTDAPGCREVVEHGRNGFLVPVKDAKALADALMRLIEAPELRAQMGAVSRQKALEEFAVEQVVSNTLALYALEQN